MKWLLPALGLLVLAAAVWLWAAIRLGQLVGGMCDAIDDYVREGGDGA